MNKPLKVLHFVTGGFSGATKVAIDLVAAHNDMDVIESLLVLRQKKTTSTEKLAELDAKDINYEVVTGSTHLFTIFELKKVCEEWQPDILVAHGFPEHILGRQAGLLAKCVNPPKLVQVEHNSKERYTPWKLYHSRRLSKYTDKIIAVSEGVAQVLIQQNLSAPIQAIANGIDTTRFGGHDIPSVASRQKDLIMVGRYAKSKDHITLIKALYALKKKGIMPHLTLVGSGQKRYKKAVIQLVDKYQLTTQIHFIEYSSEIDKLLSMHKIFVMSSRFEGLNLAVLEAMASGCVVVGSRAVGVEELILDEQDGFLFDIGDEAKLANILERILSNPQYHQPLATSARDKVIQNYDKSRVMHDYYKVFQQLLNDPS